MPWTAAAIVGAAVVGAGASNSASNDASNAQHDAAQSANSTIQQQQQVTRGDLTPWLQSGDVSRRRLDFLSGNVTLEDIQRELAQTGGYRGFDGAGGSKTYGPMEQGDFSNNNAYAQSIYDQIKKDPSFGKLTKPFGMDDFQASPAYKFNLEQGQLAIDKAAASRGKFYAPATLQDVSKFSQGMASNEFQNAYNNYNTNMGNIWNRLYSVSGSGQNAGAQLGGFGTTVASQVGANQIGAGNASGAASIAQGNSVNQGISSAYNSYLTQQILAANQGSTYKTPSSNPSSAGAGDLNQGLS